MAISGIISVIKGRLEVGEGEGIGICLTSNYLCNIHRI